MRVEVGGVEEGGDVGGGGGGGGRYRIPYWSHRRAATVYSQ